RRRGRGGAVDSRRSLGEEDGSDLRCGGRLCTCSPSGPGRLRGGPPGAGYHKPLGVHLAKVVMVGCGARVSVSAGFMAAGGHAVHGVTLWSDHADAIRTHGLRLEGASGDRTVRLSSVGTSTEGIGVCDLVIIAT